MQEKRKATALTDTSDGCQAVWAYGIEWWCECPLLVSSPLCPSPPRWPLLLRECLQPTHPILTVVSSLCSRHKQERATVHRTSLGTYRKDEKHHAIFGAAGLSPATTQNINPKMKRWGGETGRRDNDDVYEREREGIKDTLRKMHVWSEKT